MVGNLELHTKVTELLLHRAQVVVPSIDADLMESGLLDSLTLVELMASLEEEFGISISYDEIELENFRSVARIAEFVGEKKGMTELAINC